MKCLWLTRKYPRPANSGELIYSHGLIRAFAATGVQLTALAHDNEEQPVGDGTQDSTFTDTDGVHWRLGSPNLGSRLISLFTPYPGDSWRLKRGGPETLLAELLAGTTWDAIIVDQAAMGWALGPLRASRSQGRNGHGTVLVYVSHNHEASVRRDVARHSDASALRRLAARYDAEKYARQEEALCAAADLIATITERDAETYRRQFPQQRYVCLPPGYEGPQHAQREISADTPRRVIMSGSFEWVAKRVNLERFLEQAAAPLAAAGIGVQIVGKTDEAFRARMIERYPQVDLVGRVPDMTPYLLGCRLGLIVEEFGGGFKLKTLEYVFHGLPLAGLTQAVQGLPLKSPQHLILARDISELVARITEVIDDFARLNAMRRSALELCRDAFRWEDRGLRLRDAIAALKAQPQRRTQS